MEADEKNEYNTMNLRIRKRIRKQHAAFSGNI